MFTFARSVESNRTDIVYSGHFARLFLIFRKRGEQSVLEHTADVPIAGLLIRAAGK